MTQEGWLKSHFCYSPPRPLLPSYEKVALLGYLGLITSDLQKASAPYAGENKSDLFCCPSKTHPTLRMLGQTNFRLVVSWKVMENGKNLLQ